MYALHCWCGCAVIVSRAATHSHHSDENGWVFPQQKSYSADRFSYWHSVDSLLVPDGNFEFMASRRWENNAITLKSIRQTVSFAPNGSSWIQQPVQSNCHISCVQGCARVSQRQTKPLYRRIGGMVWKESHQHLLVGLMIEFLARVTRYFQTNCWLPVNFTRALFRRASRSVAFDAEFRGYSFNIVRKSIHTKSDAFSRKKDFHHALYRSEKRFGVFRMSQMLLRCVGPKAETCHDSAYSLVVSEFFFRWFNVNCGR